MSDHVAVGWWHLENASIVGIQGVPDDLHFCSWACLGSYVMAEAGVVAAFEQSLQRD